MIYVIPSSALMRYNYKHNMFKPVEDLSADEVKQLAGDWHFDNWEQFIKEFNTDGNLAPFPTEHFIVELKD
jgi:hypothetical protein